MNGVASITIVFIFAILLFVGLIFGVRYILERIREYILLQKSIGYVFFEVKLPKNNEVEIKAAEQMFTGLLGMGKKLKGMKKFFSSKSFISFEV
ncbi:hypothetical protein KC669_05190, partial [Candidatus Dojkabacteria bacterium]|nr:hypothetical protein [Candidatus Dojkabacteria bacterium]